ncbi:hypothetical protein [Bdellovibrio sp. HCB209]|uniref:hypothetical protein n=1 Tax=Bdellovibrio sp. HCB209 TaxID=3394354 RepID=UPI0039B6B0FC
MRNLINYRRRTVWAFGTYCILFLLLPFLPIQLMLISSLYLIPITFLLILISIITVEGIIFYRLYAANSDVYRVFAGAMCLTAFVVFLFVFSLIKDFIAVSEGYKYLFAEYPAYLRLNDAFTVLTAASATMLLYYICNLVLRALITGFCDFFSLNQWDWADLTLDDSITVIFAIAMSAALVFITLIPIKYIPGIAVKIHGQELVCDSKKTMVMFKSDSGKLLVANDNGDGQIQFVLKTCAKLSAN